MDEAREGGGGGQGVGARIREIREDDAVTFLELMRKLDIETGFMLLEPGERALDVTAQAEMIRQGLRDGDPMVWVAEAAGGEGVAGYCLLRRGAFRRNRHVASLVLGVAREAWGGGLGQALLARAESWAVGAGVTRLELTVVKRNERASRLYAKMGYRVEGTREGSFRVGDRIEDELYLARILERKEQGEQGPPGFAEG